MDSSVLWGNQSAGQGESAHPLPPKRAGGAYAHATAAASIPIEKEAKAHEHESLKSAITSAGIRRLGM